MKNIIFLHIPHSSLRLTKEFNSQKKYISPAEIERFNLTMTDLFTNELFSSRKFRHIKAKYSRICCDMEKFEDDSQEEMAKYGMGVIYTKTNKNLQMIDYNGVYRQSVLQKYYYPYHTKLNNAICKCLTKNKPVILVDCHSFSKEIIMNGKTQNLPDICIGSNEISNKDIALLNFTEQYFQHLGYKTKVNYPYSGSMIPNNLLVKPSEKFCSVMLEINKELYLDNLKKSRNFKKLKKDIYDYLTYLKNYNFE